MISKVTCTMVTISVSSIRISEIDIQHPSFRRKHPERSLQKAALLTPASLWGEHAESVRTQSRLAFWVNALAAEAASTAYHKIIRFATKTPPASHLCAAPGACFFLRGKLPQCQLAQNTALKFGRHSTGFFQTIYLKIVLSVVLSL